MQLRIRMLLLLVLPILCFVIGCGGSGVEPIDSEPSPDPTITIPPFTLPPVDNEPPLSSAAILPLRISVLSVNQADSIFIETPNGRRILVDGGQGDDVVKRLKTLRVWGKRLDLVILTHPHVDHVGGLLYVLSGCPITEIWETGVKDTVPNPWYAAWRLRVSMLRIPVCKVKVGQVVSYGGAEIKVIAPLKALDGQSVSVVNNASIVLKVSYGRCKALLTADAQTEEQREILSSLSHVDFFKVPHHGVTNAALENTYKKTTPDTAVIAASWPGSLVGVPSAYTLALVRKYCGRSFITYRDGTVVATMDGSSTKISTMSD